MKRKTMTLVLCLLAALALVSVGFASWVISAGTTDSVEGNIVVDEVADKRLVADATLVGDNKSFVFGAPATSTINNPWLTNDTKENLTVKVSVTVKTKSGDIVTDATVKGTISATDAYESAVAAEYVGKLPSEFTLTHTEGGVYTAEISLAWGTLWSDDQTTAQNPFTYYNNKGANGYVNGTSGKTWADQASEQLTAMYNLLKEVKFTITITATPKANA